MHEFYQKIFFYLIFSYCGGKELKFVIGITYSVLSCKLVTNFPTSYFLVFLVKTLNHHELHLIFQDIEHQNQKKYPSSLSSL